MLPPTPVSSTARRPWLRPGPLAALGLLLVVLLEVGPRTVVADPGNRLQQAAWAGFGQYQTRTSARGTRPDSRLRLDGLGRHADVELRARLARTEPVSPALQVNGAPASWRATEDPAELALTTTADADGHVELRFDIPEGARQLAIVSLAARQPGLSLPPLGRLLPMALALALSGAWLAWARADRAAFGLGALGGALVLAAALGFDRLTTLVVLPSVLLAAVFGLGCGVLAVRLGAARDSARWVAAAALLRLVLVVQPSFPCIDVGFHSGTLLDYLEGELIVSRAPNPDRHAGALPMPYPPAAYALLGPLVRWDVLPRELLVRVTLGLLEGSAPLLVLLLGRAGGLSPRAAGAAAATAAVMPEGLLVLGKGLLANAVASWAGLCALLGLMRRRFWLGGALLALTFLSHFGHTLLLMPLLAAWMAYAWWLGVLEATAVRRVALAAAAALAVAWFAYYDDVAQLMLATSEALRGSWGAGASFHGLRYVQLGKIVQDLLLKFGLLPVVLAVLGLRHAPARSPLRVLVLPWLLVGLAAAVAAVLTPVPLRFEYFCVPALALAVGLYADGASASWLRLTWRAVFALQVALGALLLADRFRLMSVILESTLWPFPVRF